MATTSSVDKRSITSLPSIESHLNELLNARELAQVNLYQPISNPESLEKLKRAFEIKNSQSQPSESLTLASPPGPQKLSPSEVTGLTMRSSKTRS